MAVTDYDLSKYDLIIFDADGTLRRATAPGQPCPRHENEWTLMPGVERGCRAILVEHRRRLAHGGSLQVAVATNQAGVEDGDLTRGEAEGLARSCLLRAFRGDWPPAYVRVATSKEESDFDRKPNPGMLLDILDHSGVSAHRTLVVGDGDEDREAAETIGADFAWAGDFFGHRPNVMPAR